MTQSSKHTLIILTPGWASSEADSTCLPMQQDLVRTIKNNYPRLNIIILAFQYPYFKKTYNWFDVTVMSFNGQNKGGLARLMRRRELNATLRKIKNENSITGILSFWYNECAAVGKIFADKNNLRHYCWILGQDARKENKYPPRIHARANELIALSDFLQDEFEKNHHIRPQHIIPAAVDTKQFNVPHQGRDIDVLAAGSLIPLKQYDVFIDVISELKKELPGIKAVLIGDGPEKEKLQNRIARSGLQQHIMLTGELQHTGVLQQMQKAKVFLHPSSYEGFGVVCIEAIAAGCHTISFCKPMKQGITHWHIAQHKEEMVQKTLDILQNKETAYRSIIPFSIKDTVEKMMRQFTTPK